MFRLIESLKVFRALMLIVFGLCAVAQSQSRSDVTANPFSVAPYIVGEKLSYNVSFSNFPTAAHVELLVAGRGQFAGREGIELRAHVETIGVVSAALYSINNDYIAFVDPATGLPYRAQQVIREGMRAEEVTSDFNVAVGAPSLPSTQFVGSPGMFDFVSALYRLRALPLAPGAVYPITAQNGGKVFNAELRVTGRELLKTNVGSSNAIVTQLRVRGDSAANDYRVRVYFTDDERHIPVLLTARLRSGEIRAELASAELLPATTTPPLVAGGTPSGPTLTPTPRANSLPPGNRAQPLGPPGASVATNPPLAGPTPLPELPFKVGEQLNFNFYIGNGAQPIGSASFQVRARAKYFNRDGLLLTSTMRTLGAMQGLFQVSDQINSYIDAASLLPFRTELNLLEGKRQNKWIISLDQNGGSALFDDGTRLDMPVNTHDLISVFYALRSFDQTQAKRTSVSLLINKRPRLLHITPLRRENIQLGGQQISAVELSLATADAQGDRFAIRLWVSTDRRRLPLRLTAQTPLGPVRADLAIIPTTLQ